MRDNTPGPNFDPPDMALDVLPVTGGARARARRTGKNFETATAIAARCGLTVDTVIDLLNQGWAFEEFINRPPQWVQPGLTAPLQDETL